ncbi:serine/threonine-protein kinase [Actinophytocola sp.]|uniref:serine/threonine-protein kinase n=1 Tax=Actinophytocola sp. TaxID=1872138 RepID=UPI003D6A48BD
MPGPEWIGRYRVSRFLGSGGFASVWLGTDHALGEPVAIKVLAENWANVRDVHQRFLREARLLRQADSDRVVRMYDVGELPDGRPYFVMSYADRGTVADRLNGVALPVPDATHIAVETARAVAVLHRLGVVHRDIKPSNVLLQSTIDGGERVLIGDLGVAKHVAQASGFTVAAGTPGYMSPEQEEQRQDIDARADVYGLGAFTFHLLAGIKYHAGALQVLTLPTRLAQVLARALEPDRDHRWPHAGAYADALADAITNTLTNTPAGTSAGAPTGALAVGRANGVPVPVAYPDEGATVPHAPPDGRPPWLDASQPSGPPPAPPGPSWRQRLRQHRTAALIAVGIVAIGVVAVVAAALGAFTSGGDEQRQAATPPPKTWPAKVTNTWSKSKNAYLGTYSYRSPFGPERAGNGYGEGESVLIECQERDGREVSDPSSGRSSTVWDRTTEGVYVSDLYTDLPKVSGDTPPNGIPACGDSFSAK